MTGQSRRLRCLAIACLVAAGAVSVMAASVAQPGSRLRLIERRESLGCGVEPAVAGFAEVDPMGRYRGLDVDVCRALAAAIFGTPAKVKFLPALTVEAFLRNDAIDVVSRRLTWELTREANLGLLFGPVTFYDGQGFLVSKASGMTSVSQLAGRDVCVAAGTLFEFNVGAYFTAHSLELKKTILESAHDFTQVAAALNTGRCRVYTGDMSDLGAIRSQLSSPADFDILPEQISKEPLAPLVRQDDPKFFTILRWTILALIRAEELGVTSANAEAMRKSTEVEVQRLLGVAPGNGKALGLREAWAYDAIRAVGNYGEMFERNLGRSSRIQLARGLNRLAKDGGLMYAPPFR